MTSRRAGDTGIDANPIVWWSVAAAIVVALPIPLFMTAIPPLLDYPNHLARMLVILLRDDPVIARMYSVDLDVVPNVAMDLVVPPLALIMPLDVAGRVFIALCLLLPIAGAAVLHRGLFGRRSYWPLCIALVSYNGLLFVGLLNFVAGLGLAMLAAGIWVRQRNFSPLARVGTGSVFALALFLCHLTAVAVYGVLIAACELQSLTREAGHRSARKIMRRGISVGLPFVIPAGLFLAGAKLARNLANGTNDVSPALWWQAIGIEGLHGKLIGLTGPFRTYLPPFTLYHQNLDIVAATLLAVFLVRALARRRLAASAGVIAVAVVALLAYPVMTPELGTTGLIDWRLPLLTTFLCFAGLDPDPPRDVMTRALAAGIALMFVARVAVIATVWDGHNRDLADLARVIAPVEPGARVLALTTTPLPVPGGDPESRGILYEIDATMHLPALLLLQRHAFWPNLFTSRNLQPVHVRPPYLALSVDQGPLPSAEDLDAPPPAELRRLPYLLNWRGNFDYVLLMRPAALAAPLDPDVLDPVDRADIAALYRVRR
jgi:hypothetical protein